MKQIFIGKYLLGFGRVMSLTQKLMNKSKECERREQVLAFWKKHDLKATIDAFSVGRSTLFLWKQKQKENDLEPRSKRPKNLRKPNTPLHIKKAVCQLRKAFPFLGKDKISILLKDTGIKVSSSTAGRIIKRENLPSAPRQHVARTKKKKDRLPKDYLIKAPGDLVGMDSIIIQENYQKKYIITAVDYFSRIAVSRVYKNLNSKNAKDLLLRMKVALGVDIQAVNTDNGLEFMKEYEAACRQLHILHFWTYPRTPKMNPYAERFNRTLQEEARFPLFEESIDTWNNFVNHYIMIYNFFRPHFALDYKTPVDIFLGSKKSNMLWTHTSHCGKNGYLLG
jgi:transposase InsO family protein